MKKEGRQKATERVRERHLLAQSLQTLSHQDLTQVHPNFLHIYIGPGFSCCSQAKSPL